MKKIQTALFVFLIAFALGTQIVFAQGEILPVDAGNYNDYGGGYSGGSSYGGSSSGSSYGGSSSGSSYDGGGGAGSSHSGGSSYGGSSGYSGSSYGSSYSSGYRSGKGSLNFGDISKGGALALVFGPIIVLGIWAYCSYMWNKDQAKGPPVDRRIGQANAQQAQSKPAAPAVQDNTQPILTEILKIDPLFDKEKFIAWSKEVYVTLQQAWMERDWSKIRPFEKEELFAQHQKLLQEYIDKGRINMMERINVNQVFLQKYERDPQYELLTVYMQVRMRDYIIEEKTKKVLMGNPYQDCHMQYLLKFTRKTGVKTDPASKGNGIVACPHCGAPTKITSAGKCEYCDFIVTTGEFGWVLCDMMAVKPGVSIDNTATLVRENNTKAVPSGQTNETLAQGMAGLQKALNDMQEIQERLHKTAEAFKDVKQSTTQSGVILINGKEFNLNDPQGLKALQAYIAESTLFDYVKNKDSTDDFGDKK